MPLAYFSFASEYRRNCSSLVQLRPAFEGTAVQSILGKLPITHTKYKRTKDPPFIIS
jgi:hypothetical protein